VLELSEFIVRAAFAIREGQPFKEAFQIAASHGQYRKLDPITHLEAAQNGNASDHLKTSADFGLTCHFADAFPLVLFYALHFGEHFAECLSLNALAGGDNTARAMMLAIFFAARDGDVGAALFPQLNLTSSRQDQSFKAGANPISFISSQGQISGVLELPETEPIATAIFAHCFTCGKDFLPEKRITQALAERGIATLRIDFSGIGSSDGDFAQSSFLTNLDDLSSAAKWLSEQFSTPEILIGHSLGGAAVLAAAKHIPSVKAVATIGAPADPAHVTHLFENHLEDIEAHGEATVRLAGRPFTVGKRFLDDLKTHQQAETLSQLKGISTLIMHAPQDDIVPLKNAGHIYSALQHPKSFISLAGADHLLTQQKDAEYVADLIKIWSSRSLEG